ncbi:hypothetical protein KSC_093860 [Ktedonobacter sp. SOSP1-52]|uniref:hypothetical protein n=1 Tax=Ktedonobacter sp. SOSP1-52 TaxID=2778366 RepID=UPI001915A574|nr:hypothetical protein [Ktedonobacter sp. SOSP1-52]GHO70494.1 hypothetical protein KSC_093860 [Ktedonobacter sp. SOSP1-52]
MSDFRTKVIKAKIVILTKDNVDHALADDGSGSMSTKDVRTGGRFSGTTTRWAYTVERSIELAQQAERFDHDGIDFAVFNHGIRIYESQTSGAIAQTLRSNRPGGGTATHLAVEWGYQLYQRKVAAGGYNKKFRLTVVTDGETDLKALQATIVRIANEVGAQAGKQGNEDGYPFNITFLLVGDENAIPIDFFEQLDRGLSRLTDHDIVKVGRLENAEIKSA